jgi:Ser/Thr protein kinase RdoA (MazF antagonist)
MDDPLAILHEVKPCLAEWHIEPQSIELASHSENIVYKVISQDETVYALRVHRPGYHSLAELNSEQIWTSALTQFGLQVPKAYPSRQGNYYISVKCGRSDRQVGLTGWLEGRPLASLLPAEGNFQFEILEKINEVGAICAQFHNQAASWQAPKQFTRHHLNVEGFLGENPFWGRFWEVSSLTITEQRTLTTVRKVMAQRLEEFGQHAKTYSMIHADLHEHNVMVTDNGLVVIDFDDAGFGWHQYDLAVAIFSYKDKPDFETIQNALIEGYRSKRDLCDEDLSWLPLFIQVRNLALIGWASARPELDQDDFLPYLIDSACRTEV